MPYESVDSRCGAQGEDAFLLTFSDSTMLTYFVIGGEFLSFQILEGSRIFLGREKGCLRGNFGLLERERGNRV